MLDERETTECNKLIDDYVLDTKSELRLPVNRNQVKYCFELLKNKINIDKEDGTSAANGSSAYDDCLRSFDMVERKVHVDDKKISILFRTVRVRMTGRRQRYYLTVLVHHNGRDPSDITRDLPSPSPCDVLRNHSGV